MKDFKDWDTICNLEHKVAAFETLTPIAEGIGMETTSGKFVYHILRYFQYDHLPPHLQEASKPFHDLAEKIAEKGKDVSETNIALRKLLEAKDAAVRSIL